MIEKKVSDLTDLERYTLLEIAISSAVDSQSKETIARMLTSVLVGYYQLESGADLVDHIGSFVVEELGLPGEADELLVKTGMALPDET